MFWNRTKTVDGLNPLVDRLSQFGPDSVLVEAVVRMSRTSNTKAVGRLGEATYTVVYRASRGKKKRTFREPVLVVFQSQRGMADREERGERLVRLGLKAEKRAQQLRNRLPEVRVELGDCAGVELSPETLRKYHSIAETLDLKPL